MSQALKLLCILLAAFAAGWMAQGWRKNAEIAQMRTEQAQERIRQALAEKDAVEQARLEEQRRTRAQTEIANDAKKQADAARADARVADAAAKRLRQRVATLLRERDTARGAAPATGSPPVEATGVVLADVFSRVDARAGELAEALDAASIAGRACERSYGALNMVRNVVSSE